MSKYLIAVAMMIGAPAASAQDDTVEVPAGPTLSPPIFQLFEQQTVEDSLPSVRIVYRHGRTPAGNEYKYFQDGSGSLSRPGRKSNQSEWMMKCKTDAMTDVETCSLRNYDAKLTLWFDSSNIIDEACVIGHDYPGRRGAIRVDALPPVTTMPNGCIRSPALIQQILNGKKITTRAVTFPNDYSVDTVMEIGPVVEAMALLRYIQINRATFADWEK